jgi:hypothetical protein
MHTLPARHGIIHTMVIKAFALSAIVASLSGIASLAAQSPVPPVKPGLWETRMSMLDANGKEVPSPEFAALARMPPAQRAQMAEAMRARGVQLPDESGAIKACVTHETLDSGTFQQLANESGCTTNYLTRSASVWKWHTSCPSLKTESDGEMTFIGSESYRTRIVSTTSRTGAPTTSTRIVQGKWLSAACGDVKPFTPIPAAGRGK